ncbi:MAG: PH domain-containing protein [bacterium]|nr:PH domain-containing protein [bacterium]
MIHLNENEKVLMVLHKHWIIIVGRFIAGAFLAILPLLVVPAVLALDSVQKVIQLDNAGAAILFFQVIYLMIIALLLFMFWVDYYLDMWIITSERIIDINQMGLFRREISEFMLDKIQDITVVIPDFMATLLKYGNINIQTAGEKSFEIKQIHKVYEAKNIILDASKALNNKKYVGS